MAGVVEEISPGVTAFRSGDQVYGMEQYVALHTKGQGLRCGL
jgi:NADPH:quinone reductase-like Zn-dependent oxidoreductase